VPARSYISFVIAGLLVLSAFRSPLSAFETLPLDALRPGMKGEVWTVFQGTEPESFGVQVTGIVRNALGPGKSLIICELTDPRVQPMGATAGMSGSPLYIDGKFAGALSYQIQSFETVRYAGFTPAADLAEVSEKVGTVPIATTAAAPPIENQKSKIENFSPCTPVFTFGGLSPAVAELLAPHFAAIGLTVAALGGSQIENQKSKIENSPLRPGSSVSVALATGDITLAGTGTVSTVDGDRVTAFGHPLLTLGEAALAMCSAEVVTILPSSQKSMKLVNTGPVIGTIRQDRLSAVSGTLGTGPAMIPVEINVASPGGPARTLRYSVVRQAYLTPAIVAAGVAQAILGSNDAGLSEGFRLDSNIVFPAGQSLAGQTLYPGPQAFALALNDFLQSLSASLLNPYEKTFPDRLTFTIEPLAENPLVIVDLFQLSRTTARAGETVEATLAWRDFQGATHREVQRFTLDPAWTGKTLDIVLANGRQLDELTGRPRVLPAAQFRSFDSFLAAMRDDRHNDGAYLAVLEKSPVFTDQDVPTVELPGTFERIARTADEARFQHRDALVTLWETHLLADRIVSVLAHRQLQVTE
jgi:SpoIVB peptidase S55